MKLLLFFLISECIAVPDLFNVANLSKTFNYLTITSKSGIGVYDLNNGNVYAIFSTSNPECGVLAPDLSKIFFIRNRNELCVYNVLFREEFFLTTFDFFVEKLGIGHRSLIVQGSGKELLLDHSGFPIPDSLKEKFYNFASLELKKPINLPPLLNLYGDIIPFSTVLFDSLTSSTFVGTRGYGVFVFSRQKRTYVDSITLGLPEVSEIIASHCVRDNIFLLTPNSLVRLAPDFKSKVYVPHNLEPDEKFTGMNNSLSLPLLITNRGRIFTLLSDRLVFEKKLDITPQKVFDFKEEKILFLEENTIKLMTIEGETLLLVNLPPIYENLKAFITDGGIVFLVDGRLYLYQIDSLFNIVEKHKIDERIIDFDVIDDELWVVTFSKLCKIKVNDAVCYKLPFQNPDRVILSCDRKLYITKVPFVATLEGMNFTIESIPLREREVVGINVISKGKIITTKKALYMCE
ncbi:MAG: hypothetical protein QMD82_03030 [bacterium]|nr:hypothetical protein [bacterium]